LTWLRTLTHNKAVDLIRLRQRQSALDVQLEAGDDDPAPTNVVLRSEDRLNVVRALQHLRKSEREVVVLAHYGGYSQQQIATRIGLPLGTVKGRSRHATQLLRDYLSNE
jgi:RNA polymerase sigma-70 factor (ECF subfamily)